MLFRSPGEPSTLVELQSLVASSAPIDLLPQSIKPVLIARPSPLKVLRSAEPRLAQTSVRPKPDPEPPVRQPHHQKSEAKAVPAPQTGVEPESWMKTIFKD